MPWAQIMACFLMPVLLMSIITYGYVNRPEVLVESWFLFSLLFGAVLLGAILVPIFIYAKINRETLSPPADHVSAKTPSNMLSWIFIGIGLWKAIEWYFGL